jgi:ABC-type maltose transport system permease subunit
MAIVQGKAHCWRLIYAHTGIIAFTALILFPLLMVISSSLRPGNFASGSIIPTEISLDHWKLALGIGYQAADGSWVAPPFPVMRWLWNSIKIAAISALLILILSTTAAYAFARMQFKFKNPIITSILVTQMFPAVLALVAIYAISIPSELRAFPRHRFTAPDTRLLWRNRCISGPSAATTTPYRWRSKNQPKWMALLHSKPSAMCCCPWRCRF